MSSEAHTARWLDLDGTANARAVLPHVLLRADNLQSLTERDIRQLVDRETLEVVLDLRTDIEVRSEGPGPLTEEGAVRIEHRSFTRTTVATPTSKRKRQALGYVRRA